MKDPVIQKEFLCIIARFKPYKLVLFVDVKKMYWQILVIEKDQSIQKKIMALKPR